MLIESEFTNRILEIFAEQQNNLAQLHRDYLTIAIMIIIFIGGIFYLLNLRPFQTRLNKQEKTITDIEDNIREKLTKIDTYRREQKKSTQELTELSKKTIALMEKQKAEVLSLLTKQELASNAEKSRSLALHAQREKLFNKMFYWWINAAYYFYKKNKEEPLVSTAIKSARQGLENMTEEHIKFLKKDLPETEEMMDELTKKYPEQIRAIRELLVRKLESLKGK